MNSVIPSKSLALHQTCSINSSLQLNIKKKLTNEDFVDVNIPHGIHSAWKVSKF